MAALLIPALACAVSIGRLPAGAAARSLVVVTMPVSSVVLGALLGLSAWSGRR